MKNKKWLIPVIVISLVLVVLIGSVCFLAINGYGISHGRYLESKNGQPIFILDNSPITMSNRTAKDLFGNCDVGDKILVIHDGIAESYPGKTGVYAVFKLSDGTTGDIPQNVVNQLIDLGWLETGEEPDKTPSDVVSGGTTVGEAFDIAISYANWTHAPMESFGALNTDKLAISSVQHLPIYRFDTLKDLEQFKLFDDRFTFDSGYDEIPSFNDTVAKYNEVFFEENSLMLVYVSANSGSYRYGVNSVFCDGTSFCIHVEQTNNPESVTDNMSGWFITVAVPDSMIENCTEFDADLNNTEN